MSTTNFSFSGFCNLESVDDDFRLKKALKELEDVKENNIELTRTIQELEGQVNELTVEPKAIPAFNGADVISKLKEFGLKCSRLHERIEADSEKSPEAQRIVELEGALEKLRMEKIALSKEVYLMVNEMSSKVQDLEKARKKEEMENEVLKKELDEKKGEISALREQLHQADKTDKPLSIGTSILGKWQLKHTC